MLGLREFEMKKRQWLDASETVAGRRRSVQLERRQDSGFPVTNEDKICPAPRNGADYLCGRPMASQQEQAQTSSANARPRQALCRHRPLGGAQCSTFETSNAILIGA